MNGLALVDFENLYKDVGQHRGDLTMVAQTIVTRVARKFASIFPEVRSLDVRLYGGWTERLGGPTQHSVLLQAALPSMRGRRHGLIVRPILAESMLILPDLVLKGTYRWISGSPQQKMVDQMLGCDAIHTAQYVDLYVAIVTTDDDLLPATITAHVSSPGTVVWMRNRPVGSACNDSELLDQGLYIVDLRS